jgi:hypothetical protein
MSQIEFALLAPAVQFVDFAGGPVRIGAFDC